MLLDYRILSFFSHGYTFYIYNMKLAHFITLCIFYLFMTPYSFGETDSYHPKVELLTSLSTSIINQPDFGIINSSWIPSNTLVLDTANGISGGGISDHYGGQNSGEIILTSTGLKDITVMLDVISQQPTNTNLVFSDPVCKIGITPQVDCGTALSGRTTAGGNTIIKVGATLAINTNFLSETPTPPLTGSAWFLTITYS